jgi:aromatic-L-amino-acid decarboxylase
VKDDPIVRAARAAVRHLDAIGDERASGSARFADLAPQLERSYPFDAPRGASELVDDIARMLASGAVHAAHPGYLGPFQGGGARSAIAASVLVAAYDPQCAVATHGAAALAMEQHALGAIARAIGWEPAETSAHTTSGGQEANLEALVVATARACPEVRERGVRALAGEPTVYASSEAHHGIEKAAHAAGLGRRSVRRVATDGELRMDVRALEDAIARDRAASLVPIAIVATAGTTSSGAIDPLAAIAALAEREQIWLHCDAAWGGAAVLSPRLRPLLAGIERARSIAIDGHKWLQLPLGTGMFFCRDRSAVRAAFETDAPYMPAPREDAIDPYRSSLAWSRRGAGVPLFALLAERGIPGVAEMLDRMTELGALLRARLAQAGFRVLHPSPLPVACFTHPRIESGAVSTGRAARAVQARGRVWISPTRVAGTPALRACIDNARTEARDLDALVEDLAAAIA